MFSKIVQFTNNLKLKHKLLISYIVVVMIPVLIVGAVVTAYFRNQAMDRAIAQTVNNVERVKSRAASMLRVPSDISDIFMLDKKLEALVTTRYPSVLELTKAYLEYDDFRAYVRLYREISGIRFYFDNPTLINNLEFIPVDERTASANWYQKAMAEKGSAGFTLTTKRMRSFQSTGSASSAGFRLKARGKAECLWSS